MLRPSENLDLLLVGDIESQIGYQPYNQLYRLILNRKMGENWDNRSSSAVYMNTQWADAYEKEQNSG